MKKYILISCVVMLAVINFLQISSNDIDINLLQKKAMAQSTARELYDSMEQGKSYTLDADGNLEEVEEVTPAQGADAIYVGWSNVAQGQGFYKDEWVVQEPCPNEESTNMEAEVDYQYISGSGNYEHAQSGTSGRSDIRCTNGNTNCSSISC